MHTYMNFGIETILCARLMTHKFLLFLLPWNSLREQMKCQFQMKCLKLQNFGTGIVKEISFANMEIP